MSALLDLLQVAGLATAAIATTLIAGVVLAAIAYRSYQRMELLQLTR